MSGIVEKVASSARRLSVDTHIEHGRASDDLARMGYKQELVRTRSTAHVVFMCFVLASIPYGLSTTMLYSLPNGGPATVIWGWVFLIFITFCVATSLAEICSAYPTAGGVYYQTFMLAPKRWRVILSWICGWSFVVGNVTITLAVQFATAQFLIGCINVFKDSNGNGIFLATTGQTYAVFVATVLLCSFVSALFNRWLHYLDTFAIFWTFAGLISIIVCILAIAKNGRHSAAYAFGHFDASGSGWPSAWAWFVGLLQAAYACSSTGMVVSMCEEVDKPETQVPKAMVTVILVNGIAGIAFLVPLMFVLPDLAYLNTLAQPIPEIILSAVGNPGGSFALLIPLIVLGFICGIGCTTAACRSVWAFSRDGAIPGFKLWRIVNHSLDVPINALILTTITQLLLGLIYFGSSAAFNAFSGVGVICLGLSYWVPIFTSFVGGRTHVEKALYNKGKFGFFANIVSIVWFLFAIPLFCFPTVIPVTAESMNYASVVFVGFTVLSIVYYFIRGRNHFKGPPTGELSLGSSSNATEPSQRKNTDKDKNIDLNLNNNEQGDDKRYPTEDITPSTKISDSIDEK